MFMTLGRLLIVSIYLSIPASGFASDTLSIYWIDSEGGGSTLIITPARETILIDSGNPGMRDARRIHQVLTAVAGEKRIDHLITTHFHIDHFGGAAELASMVPVGHVYDNGAPRHDPDGNPDSAGFLARIKPYLDFPAEGRHIVKAGDTVPLKQQGSKHLSLTVLAAQQKFFRQNVGAVTNTFCAGELRKPAIFRITRIASSCSCAMKNFDSSTAETLLGILRVSSSVPRIKLEKSTSFR